MGLLVLILAGCNTPLFERAQNPLVYSCCFIVLAVLEVIAVLEITGSRRPAVRKAIWILLVLFVPGFGLVLYYLFGRR